MMPYDQVEKKLANNIIEIAPIAFMRGRTLEDCFIILDEAQNTTKIQMKMFLTRLGKNSKMVVVGDNTQIDLISKNDSGLIDASKKLKKIQDIGFIELDQKDVIRHEVVRKIINATTKITIKARFIPCGIRLPIHTAKPVAWTALARLKPPPNRTSNPHGTFSCASFHSRSAPFFSLLPLGSRNRNRAEIIAIPASDRPLRNDKLSNTVLNIHAMAVKKKTINTFSSGPFRVPNSSFIEDNKSVVSFDVSKFTLKIIFVRISQLQGSMTALKGTPTFIQSTKLISSP